MKLNIIMCIVVLIQQKLRPQRDHLYSPRWSCPRRAIEMLNALCHAVISNDKKKIFG